MKDRRGWAVLRDCLVKNRMGLLLWALTLLTELAVFLLYDVMLEPLAYAAALTLFIGLVLLAVEVGTAWRQTRERQRLCAAIV